MRKVLCFCDGGSRGNGSANSLAATGVVIKDYDSGKIIYRGGTLLSKGSTNNDAEWNALIEVIKECIKQDYDPVEIFMDSELAVKQFNGVYKAKSEKLAGYKKIAKSLSTALGTLKVTHVLREHNRDADECANRVMDSKQSFKEIL